MIDWSFEPRHLLFDREIKSYGVNMGRPAAFIVMKF